MTTSCCEISKCVTKVTVEVTVMHACIATKESGEGMNEELCN